MTSCIVKTFRELIIDFKRVEYFPKGKKISYIQYQAGTIMPEFIGTLVWIAMGTLMVMSKATLKEDLSIADLIVFIAILLGTFVAFTSLISYRTAKLIDGIADVMLAIILIYLLLHQDLYSMAISITVYKALSSFMREITGEKSHHMEVIASAKYNNEFKDIRRVHTKLFSIAGVLGGMLGVLMLKIIKLDIYEFGILMVCVHTMLVLYELSLAYRLAK